MVGELIWGNSHWGRVDGFRDGQWDEAKVQKEWSRDGVNPFDQKVLCTPRRQLSVPGIPGPSQGTLGEKDQRCGEVEVGSSPQDGQHL